VIVTASECCDYTVSMHNMNSPKHISNSSFLVEITVLTFYELACELLDTLIDEKLIEAPKHGRPEARKSWTRTEF